MLRPTNSQADNKALYTCANGERHRERCVRKKHLFCDNRNLAETGDPQQRRTTLNFQRGACFCIILIALTAQAAPFPQNPPDEPPPATFQSSIQLLQVRVIAEDKDGKPITDLRQDEFQLLDNGLPQNIRLFLNESERPGSALPSLPPGTFTNRAESRPGGNSGYSVIVIDTLLTALADEYQGGSGAIWAIQKAVKALHSLPPGENVAIYATGYKLWVIREFTQDRESLEQKLRKWKPTVDVLPEDLKVEVLRNEIEQVAAHVAAIPGRKNLIWVAYRFPIAPPVLQKLRLADVAVYPVDAHGSVIGLKTDKQLANLPLRGLAAATGGVAYFDRDDLDVAIREAIDDGRSNYELGFYPFGDDSVSRVRQIALHVTRPGVRLRYRNIYQTEPPRKPAPARVADLVQAMFSPVDAMAIPIRASARRIPEQTKQAQTNRNKANQDRLSFDTVLDVASLDLAPLQSRWAGNLEVVAQFMAADGRIVGARPALDQTVKLNFSQPTYDAAAQRGLLYSNEVKIPANAVEFKILIANLANGKIGTVTIPLSEVRPPE
jgi:VWFA-related protein